MTLEGVPDVRVIPSENPLEIESGEQAQLTLVVIVPEAAFSGGRRRIPVEIRVSDGKGFETSLAYRLVGPGGSQ